MSGPDDFPPVFILAGGRATRLGELARSVPKAMVEVYGHPFIYHQLNLLKRRGIRRVILCVGYLAEQIESFVGDGREFGLTVQYHADGPNYLGTGGAIRAALHMVQSEFAVLYGDTLLDIDYLDVHRAFLASQKQGLMTVLANQDRWDKSNIVFSDGMVVAYSKSSPTPQMQYIDYGLSIFSHDAFAGFNAQPFDLSAVFESLIRQQQLAGFEVHKRFYEIGTPAGLAETEEFLSSAFQ